MVIFKIWYQFLGIIWSCTPISGLLLQYLRRKKERSMWSVITCVQVRSPRSIWSYVWLGVVTPSQTGHMWSPQIHLVTCSQLWSPQVHLLKCGHPKSIWLHVVRCGHPRSICHPRSLWSHVVTPSPSDHMWSGVVTPGPTGHMRSGLVTPGPSGQVWSPQFYLVTCGQVQSPYRRSTQKSFPPCLLPGESEAGAWAIQ